MSLFSSEAKPVSNWYAATTHYLTGGLVAPAIVVAVLTYFLKFLSVENWNSILLDILSVILFIFSLWIGVIYSVSYLKRHYLIQDSNRILKLSAVYYVIGSSIMLAVSYALGILILIGLALGGGSEFSCGDVGLTQLCKGPSNFIIYGIIQTMVGVFLFYSFSKRHLK